MKRWIPVAALLLLAACSRSGPNNTSEPPPPAPLANNASGGTTTTSTGPDTPTPNASDWKYQSNLDRAIRHILDTQREGRGDWGDMRKRPMDIYLGTWASMHVFGNASTALCCMALMRQPATEEIDTALDRGLNYLIKAPDTPRVTMQVFYNTWAHSYMIQCFTRAASDKRFATIKGKLLERAKLELRRLLQLQGLDGGWGYYDFKYGTYRPSGDISTVFTGAAAMVALKEAREAGLDVPDRNIEAGLSYIESQRIPNGAYFYSSGHKYYPQSQANLIRGSIGRAQSGDNALHTWNRKINTKELQNALDRFFKEHIFIEIGRGRQFPHEAWYATAPYYYYFGHYYASRNVLALPDDVRGKYADRLAKFVVDGQYDDGSFWDYPLYGYSKAYGTGFGALILSNCRDAMRPTR